MSGLREKHLNEYGVCEKCNNKQNVNRELSTHQRTPKAPQTEGLGTWLCAKSGLGREPNLEDFYRWVLDNQDNLLSMYKHAVPTADTYFMQREDKQ